MKFMSFNQQLSKNLNGKKITGKWIGSLRTHTGKDNTSYKGNVIFLNLKKSQKFDLVVLSDLYPNVMTICEDMVN